MKSRKKFVFIVLMIFVYIIKNVFFLSGFSEDIVQFIAVLSINGVLLIGFIINIMINPGYLKKKNDFLNLIENIKNNGESKVCIYCNTVRSKMIKHCDIC